MLEKALRPLTIENASLRCTTPWIQVTPSSPMVIGQRSDVTDRHGREMQLRGPCAAIRMLAARPRWASLLAL